MGEGVTDREDEKRVKEKEEACRGSEKAFLSQVSADSSEPDWLFQSIAPRFLLEAQSVASFTFLPLCESPALCSPHASLPLPSASPAPFTLLPCLSRDQEGCCCSQVRDKLVAQIAGLQASKDQQLAFCDQTPCEPRALICRIPNALDENLKLCLQVDLHQQYPYEDDWSDAVTHFNFLECNSQKQMNILSISSKTQGKWIYESWVIGIPRVRGGVTILQNSFSRKLTCETVLRDLSVKLQHALQKN
ncbi:hypothetical protein MJG53_012576 [Ovis ammon polii x Ovis aries]|uniref:Uncharacterized protein n=1 Tax=Ovis ammon polii x Ovis aries TaxID=2918886 RepID=A0ACB9ULA0_9CETA|nr:hypothetical protein MJG53_012576 [Ovis ammon polii x Ovis aries]